MTCETISLGAAKASSQARYFTGEPCAHGHIAERSVASRTCVECEKRARKAWYDKLRRPEYADKKRELRRRSRAKESAATRRRAEDPANWPGILLRGARLRAKKRGLEFDIEPGEIEVVAVCPILGIELSMGGNSEVANSPSLDRIDNSKGYIRGNVRIISHRANALKRDATLAEVEAIARYMRESLP